jgi:hypothetical protein
MYPETIYFSSQKHTHFTSVLHERADVRRGKGRSRGMRKTRKLLRIIKRRRKRRRRI